MDFQILGPLEVRDGDREVRLRGTGVRIGQLPGDTLGSLDPRALYRQVGRGVASDAGLVGSP
jgi:hypothetical protein